MKRRRPRGLDPEEEALWERVAKTATPLDRSKPAKPSMEAEVATPTKQSAPEIKGIKPFRVGEKASGRATPLPRAETAVPRMDSKTYARMKRGKTRPEARLDLHGMTLNDAETALAGFVFRAHSEGKRLILVITGKGRDRDDGGPIPVRAGVLRRQVPDWLRRPPLSAVVLDVAEAHQRHGGSGALYVYLKRK